MKNFVSNIAVAAFTNILGIFVTILAQYFILNSFGSEINGLTPSVNQFLVYFTLLEAGIGAASVQALYKPLVDKNNEKRDSILSATHNQYRKVGIIFFVLLVALSLLMPVLTRSSLESILVITITFLMGLAHVINYLFIGKYRVLLSADKRIYVLNTLDSFLGIVFSVIRIILINTGFSIITVQAVALLSPIVRMIFLRFYVKRRYVSVNLKAKPDYSSISKSKNVLVHHAVGMVTQHTDVLILTLGSSLKAVSVYSVYNLIYAHICSILSNVFGTAPQASFGHLLESKNPKFNDYYKVYEVFFTALILAIISIALVLTLPFVSLYTVSVTDVNYIDLTVAILFAITAVLSAIRLPFVIMVNVTGTFKETQRGAIIEAIINIAVSIPAYIFFEMKGLLFGTVVALLFRSIDISYFCYKHVMKKSYLGYLKVPIVGIITAVAYCGFFMFVKPVLASSWGEWFLSALICASIGIVLFFAVFCIFFRKETIMVFRMLKKFLNRKSKVKG